MEDTNLEAIAQQLSQLNRTAGDALKQASNDVNGVNTAIARLHAALTGGLSEPAKSELEKMFKALQTELAARHDGELKKLDALTDRTDKLQHLLDELGKKPEKPGGDGGAGNGGGGDGAGAGNAEKPWLGTPGTNAGKAALRTADYTLAACQMWLAAQSIPASRRGWIPVVAPVVTLAGSAAREARIPGAKRWALALPAVGALLSSIALGVGKVRAQRRPRR